MQRRREEQFREHEQSRGRRDKRRAERPWQSGSGLQVTSVLEDKVTSRWDVSSARVRPPVPPPSLPSSG
ncbi:hypothetical protein E2C01_043276 [Portunus trituberculatus]|uniref:Uncharacterized protein n=1 Tax=Portunus trituberculatus TaxID=210409 RepID=A0A5B7FZ41_PORTR|nr:hypothetical protein [Portunus trituberculatus]